VPLPAAIDPRTVKITIYGWSTRRTGAGELPYEATLADNGRVLGLDHPQPGLSARTSTNIDRLEAATARSLQNRPTVAPDVRSSA
jgi:hypothetical protein